MCICMCACTVEFRKLLPNMKIFSHDRNKYGKNSRSHKSIFFVTSLLSRVVTQLAVQLMVKESVKLPYNQLSYDNEPMKVFFNTFAFHINAISVNYLLVIWQGPKSAFISQHASFVFHHCLMDTIGLCQESTRLYMQVQHSPSSLLLIIYFSYYVS